MAGDDREFTPDADRELDEIKAGDRPVPARLKKFPKVGPPDPSELNVDECYANIRIYLAHRWYHQCLEEARKLFDWYTKGGYFPVPCTLFEIEEWPPKNTELYRLLLYCNIRKQRGARGEWPL